VPQLIPPCQDAALRQDPLQCQDLISTSTVDSTIWKSRRLLSLEPDLSLDVLQPLSIFDISLSGQENGTSSHRVNAPLSVTCNLIRIYRLSREQEEDM
jgi:hypothetical protein